MQALFFLSFVQHKCSHGAGGISVTLVGHPFDTLKVRLQTQPVDKPLYCELWLSNSLQSSHLITSYLISIITSITC